MRPVSVSSKPEEPKPEEPKPSDSKDIRTVALGVGAILF